MTTFLARVTVRAGTGLPQPPAGPRPITLINPEGAYGALIKPSLAALWLSRLIVFAVYPRFAVRHRKRALPAWTLAVAASALAVYGIWVTTAQVSGT